jgi:transcriptional regulator with XRE-family HTH domain
MDEIRHRIRSLRISKGWSLPEFAERSGGQVTAIAMGSYERGGRTLSTPKLLVICHTLGVSLIHLLEFDPQLIQGQLSGRHIYDLRKLQQLTPSPEKTHLISYIEEIIRVRGDWKGAVLSLRASDVENLTRIFKVSNEINCADYHTWLAKQEVTLTKI